jgi:hypothetical protein
LSRLTAGAGCATGTAGAARTGGTASAGRSAIAAISATTAVAPMTAGATLTTGPAGTARAAITAGAAATAITARRCTVGRAVGCFEVVADAGVGDGRGSQRNHRRRRKYACGGTDVARQAVSLRGAVSHYEHNLLS